MIEAKSSTSTHLNIERQKKLKKGNKPRLKMPLQDKPEKKPRGVRKHRKYLDMFSWAGVFERGDEGGWKGVGAKQRFVASKRKRRTLIISKSVQGREKGVQKRVTNATVISLKEKKGTKKEEGLRR